MAKRIQRRISAGQNFQPALCAAHRTLAGLKKLVGLGDIGQNDVQF